MHVGSRKLVMVRELEVFYNLVSVAEILQEGSVVGYAAEEYQPLGIEVAVFALGVDRLEGAVVYCSEEQMAVLVYLQILSPPLPLAVIHIMRALADYYDVRVAYPFLEVSQATQGHEAVLEDRSVVIHEHYGHGRPEFSVLEAVVEDDDVRSRDILVDATTGLFVRLQKPGVGKKAAALDPVLVHGHSYEREFLFDLERLVPVEGGGAVHRYVLEATAFPPVSPGEHGEIPSAPQRVGHQGAKYHFCMRGLPCPTYRDIAYRDDRHFGASDLLQSGVIQRVPDFQAQVVREKNYPVNNHRSKISGANIQ